MDNNMPTTLNNHRRRSRLVNATSTTRNLLLLVGFVALATLLVPYCSLARWDPDNHEQGVDKTKTTGSSLFQEALVAWSTLANPTQRSGGDHYEKSNACDAKYQRVTASAVPGLTAEDWERSVAYTGNRHRLALLAQKLSSRQEAISVAICGGSITMGHGVHPTTERYSDHLERRLNQLYPLQLPASTGVGTSNQDNDMPKHRVYNRGSHGADVRVAPRRVFATSIILSCPDPSLLSPPCQDVRHGKAHQLFELTDCSRLDCLGVCG
jgi:hypothetical protein